jgi:recombination protein RecA
MAKKKAAQNNEEKAEKSTKFGQDHVSNAMLTKYGDIIKTGTEVLANLNKLEVIGVSPALDVALGGGFREGSVVIMTADPKVGKTTTALHFAAKCQKRGKKIIYCNTEGRLSKHNFEGIEGLDPDSIIVIESTDEKIPTAEEYLSIVEYYINNEPGCVVIIDSTSNMVPKDEMEGELSAKVRASLPKLLALFCKRIGQTVQKNRVICIMITHNIANTSGVGQQTKWSDCGNQVKYQAGTNISASFSSRWQIPKDDGPQVGQTINWKVITSTAGGTPGSTAESWLRYGIGIDETQELFSMACEFGLIKSAGAWYTVKCLMNDLENPDVKHYLEDCDITTDSKLEDIEKAFKFQGGVKVYNFLKDNPNLRDLVYTQLRELLF